MKASCSSEQNKASDTQNASCLFSTVVNVLLSTLSWFKKKKKVRFCPLKVKLFVCSESSIWKHTQDTYRAKLFTLWTARVFDYISVTRATMAASVNKRCKGTPCINIPFSGIELRSSAKCCVLVIKKQSSNTMHQPYSYPNSDMREVHGFLRS